MKLFCPKCMAELTIRMRDGWAIARCPVCGYTRALEQALREALNKDEREEVTEWAARML